jgi:eukaryotic-like serine/threonine-protein kinase
MSLKATRLYSEGLQQLHSFNSVSARDLLEQAVTEDPNYALAHSALAEAWRSLGYANNSAREAKKAMDLSAGLSRENRLAIEAQYRNSTHEAAREMEIYKTLFNFYPDNLEYGLSLAKSEYFSSQFQEAISTLDALQQLPSPAGDDLRIDVVRTAVATRTGDYKKALALAERVQLRAQQIGAKRLAAQALQNQCELLPKLGEPAEASAACDKSRLIFADVGDFAGEAAVWGQIAYQAEDPKSGRIANEKQISLLKKVQSDGGLAWAMTVAGELSADLGDYARGLREYTEALRLYQKVGDQLGAGSAYGNLGWVNSLQGNLIEAVKNDEEAIALTRQTNSKREMDLWLADLAEVSLEQGDVQGAMKQLDEGLQINNDTDDKRAAVYLHTTRSKLLLAEGDLDESRREARLASDPLLLARLDIAQDHSQTAVDGLRKALANSKTQQEDDNQIEARALLIQALLATPSDESKREVTLLARVVPNTPNVSLRLTANLQIARARLALGDKVGATQLLTQVISESQRLGYESQWLEERLTQAEMEIQSGDLLAGRRQIDQVAKEAEARGLMLIANEARRNL